MDFDVIDIFKKLNLGKDKDIMNFIKKHTRKRMFEPYEALVKENDNSENVYIILSGKAKVYKHDKCGNEIFIADLSEGDMLGEMALFLNNKRTATVVAVEKLIVAEFSTIDFIKALVGNPELALRVISSFSNNLKSSNELVVKLQDMLVCKSVCFWLFNQKLNDDEELIITVSDVIDIFKITNEQFVKTLNYLLAEEVIELMTVIYYDKVKISYDKYTIYEFIIRN